MADQNDNVISLHSGYPPHPQEARQDENWPRLRDTALAQAFLTCHRHLLKTGRSCLVQHGVGSTSEKFPFSVLGWEGDGALKGQNIGLHFTYNWVDRVAFNLAGVRVRNGHLEQGNYYSRCFRANDRQVAGIILELVDDGMERAKALSEMETLPEIAWRQTFPIGRVN